MSYINDDKKYKLFINKFENEKEFKKELNNIFNIILKKNFKDILNIPKIDFLNKLSKEVNQILTEYYSSKIDGDENLDRLLLSYSDISKRFITGDIFEIDDEIDFEGVNEDLDRQKDMSISFLKKALEI